MTDVLAELNAILKERKANADPKSSYVASLHAKGLNKILEKVGEECTETLIAAKDCEHNHEKQALIAETADLWFHTMVMLSHLDLCASDILSELAKRFNMSGLEEKASRITNTK